MIILEIILFVYFFLAVIHQFIFSIAGVFYRQPVLKKERPKNKIAVFIPAYREDDVIIDTVKNNLIQHYDKAFYKIIIIADHFQKITLEELNKLPVETLPANFKNSTKVKSIQYAFQNLNDDYDILVILDADNHIHPDFLSIINKAYNEGFYAIQGQRKAKNLNNSFAVLDSLSEIINNHIYRKGSQVLGLSSPVIGSGMAFQYDLAKKIFLNMNAVGGFDREFQLKIVEHGYKINYIESAEILDEKIQHSKVFKNQRRRWISSQFVYLKKYFILGFKSLFHFKIDYFRFSVLHNLFLSHILNFGILLFLSIAFTIGSSVKLKYGWWGLLFMNIVALLIPVPLKFYNRNLLKAVLRIPQVFLLMMLNLFRLKGANKKFIHTPHTKFN